MLAAEARNPLLRPLVGISAAKLLTAQAADRSLQPWERRRRTFKTEREDMVHRRSLPKCIYNDSWGQAYTPHLMSDGKHQRSKESIDLTDCRRPPNYDLTSFETNKTCTLETDRSGASRRADPRSDLAPCGLHGEPGSYGQRLKNPSSTNRYRGGVLYGHRTSLLLLLSEVAQVSPSKLQDAMSNPPIIGVHPGGMPPSRSVVMGPLRDPESRYFRDERAQFAGERIPKRTNIKG